VLDLLLICIICFVYQYQISSGNNLVRFIVNMYFVNMYYLFCASISDIKWQQPHIPQYKANFS